MKKIILFLSIIFFLNFFLFKNILAAPQGGGTTTTETTTWEYERDDSGTIPPCEFPGTGCKVKKTKTRTQKDDGLIYDNTTGHGTVTANTGPIEIVVNDVVIPNNNRTFEFPTGAKLTVVHCENFPQLNGLEIDISGIISDSDGNFTVNFTY